MTMTLEQIQKAALEIFEKSELEKLQKNEKAKEPVVNQVYNKEESLKAILAEVERLKNQTPLEKLKASILKNKINRLKRNQERREQEELENTQKVVEVSDKAAVDTVFSVTVISAILIMGAIVWFKAK